MGGLASPWVFFWSIGKWRIEEIHKPRFVGMAFGDYVCVSVTTWPVSLHTNTACYVCAAGVYTPFQDRIHLLVSGYAITSRCN